jgi:hypothetical protein
MPSFNFPFLIYSHDQTTEFNTILLFYPSPYYAYYIHALYYILIFNGNSTVVLVTVIKSTLNLGTAERTLDKALVDEWTGRTLGTTITGMFQKGEY